MSGAGSEIILRNLDRIWSQKCGGSTAGEVEQYRRMKESAFLSQRCASGSTL